MAGDGLRAIFLEQRPMLLRLLVARLGNRDDAEDALQDMWLRIDEFVDRPIAQPKAFLYRIAANLATDRRIAHGRRGARDAAWLDGQPGADELPDTERALIASDQLRTVAGVIEAMPERMRIALHMFRIQGQSQKAIAGELGISVSGVEKLLQRAYRELYDRLEPYAVEIPPSYRLAGERGENSAG